MVTPFLSSEPERSRRKVVQKVGGAARAAWNEYAGWALPFDVDLAAPGLVWFHTVPPVLTVGLIVLPGGQGVNPSGAGTTA
jgi:hypothetical protein